jgi:chromosome partitioning protein
VRKSVEGKELPVFTTALLERAAFRELHLTGQTPRQTDPAGAAAANISAITQELLARLESLQEAAA